MRKLNPNKKTEEIKEEVKEEVTEVTTAEEPVEEDVKEEPVEEAKPQKAKIKALLLNIRMAADPKSEIVGQFKEGEEVEIVGSEGDFFIVPYNGKERYVMRQFVELV